jgi:hypothetical protein
MGLHFLAPALFCACTFCACARLRLITPNGQLAQARPVAI